MSAAGPISLADLRCGYASNSAFRRTAVPVRPTESSLPPLFLNLALPRGLAWRSQRWHQDA